MSNPNVVTVDRVRKELNYDFVDLRIADKRVKTRVADTQQKRYIGLSDTDQLGKNEGMLFMYDQEKRHRLVMRDMDFALDVIHVGSNGRVAKWGSMSDPDDAVEGVSKYAIELPHGWCEKHGVAEGDPVYIEQPEDKGKLFKARRYVDSPDEVPEGYEVQQGPQGGLYYETGTDDEPAEADGDNVNLPDLEEGDEVVFETEGGQMIGTVDAIFHDGAIRIRTDDGWQIVTGNALVGYADELAGEEVEGVPFDALQEGDKIAYELDFAEEEGVFDGEGVVASVGDEFVTVDTGDGFEQVYPEEFVGLTEIDVQNDNLTGMTVDFDHGQRGYVVDGSTQGLEVEMLTGPNQGTRIYSVRRDTISDIVDENIDDSAVSEDWATPDIKEMGPGGRTEWVRENAYPHQELKVYDRATGEVREAFVDADKLDMRIGNAYVQVVGGGKENYLLGNSHRFEMIGAKTFDSLDFEEKYDAVVKTFQHGEFRSIGERDRGKVHDNFFGRGYNEDGSLIRAKDWETRRKVANGLRYIKNKVERASCGGKRGGGYYYIKLSKDEDHDTIAHELGHGIAVAFGYDYEGENASEEYGPWNLSHNFSDYAGGWSDYIDWDLSDEADFYEPEQYMFTKWDEEGEPEKYAVGYDSFKEEVDEEVDQTFRGEELIQESWDSADYEPVEDDATALQVFEGLEEGDLVRFNVPDWDAGRDEDNNPVETEHDVARFKYVEQNSENNDPYLAIFERPNGDKWRWPMGSDGELYSDWSSVDAVGLDPNIPNQDEDSDDRGSGGIPVAEQADTLTDHLALRWDGFNDDAEAPEEKAENLMRAVNRAWYKQAKVHEASEEPTDRQRVVMETGYSATNAHETMAQLHEVMQTPSDSNKQRVDDIFDEHPYLVLAYMDLWEPSPEILAEMEELLQALGIEL